MKTLSKTKKSLDLVQLEGGKEKAGEERKRGMQESSKGEGKSMISQFQGVSEEAREKERAGETTQVPLIQHTNT